jgi:heme exporter protein D
VSDFFTMGGYGAYVWPAFGFAAAVLLGLLLQSWWTARRRAAEFEQLHAELRPDRASRPRRQPVVQLDPAARAASGQAEVSRDASA